MKTRMGLIWTIVISRDTQHNEAEKNVQHFPDAIFKCIFLNENLSISIKISLKFVPWGPINNIATSV